MIKISRVEAYQYMDQADFDLMDKIHAELAAEETNNYRELSSQFFVQGDRTLYLEFYLDGVRVERIVFLQTKIKLTADGEKRLAEAVEGANLEMKNKTVEVVAGLDEGLLRSKVFDLDYVRGGIELNAATLRNIDIELGQIAENVENTKSDMESMALTFNDINHKILLLSDLMNYVTKDLKTNTKQLGDLQHVLWQEVKNYEND